MIARASRTASSSARRHVTVMRRLSRISARSEQSAFARIAIPAPSLPSSRHFDKIWSPTIPRLGRAITSHWPCLWLLPSGRAAVDRVVGACDVRRPVRSKEDRELRDLLGLTKPLEKRLAGYRVPGRLVVAEVAVAGRGQERPGD